MSLVAARRFLRRFAAVLAPTARPAALACALLCAASAVRAQVTLVLTPGSSIGTLAGSGTDAKTAAGAALSAAMGSPQGLAYDRSGNLYIADSRNHIVTRVDPDGQLTIVAGNGQQGFAGDGGPATAAQLNAPAAVAVDAAGTLFIADTGNHRIAHVAADGTIITVAGTGGPGFSGDNAPATAARLRFPSALAIDSSGALVIADTGNHRIRRLQPDGTIVTIAGSGDEGDSGDGGTALAASLESPAGLVLLPDGRLLIADRAAHRIRALNTDGTVSAYSPGPTLPVVRPVALAVDAAGTVAIADAVRQQVLQGSADGGSVLAGTGEQGRFAAGVPLATPLDTPSAVALRSNGDLAVSDRRNHQVQHVLLASLNFGSVPAGSASQSQPVTLQNGSDSPLQVLSIDLPGSFSLAAGGTCAQAPFVIAAGRQCIAAVLFAPMAQGVAGGIARVRINGAAPQSLLLTGTGIASGTLAASITSLRSDGSVAYAGTPVTLTATVAGSLLHAPSGNVTFLDGSSPLASIALSNGSASFTSAGLHTGAHTLDAAYSGDAVYGASSSAALGITVVPSPDFTLATAAKSYSGSPGGSIVVPLTLVPVNGTLNHVVQFATSGLPSGATAVFSPTTLTLGGDVANVTLTIQLPVTAAHERFTSGPYIALVCVLLPGVFLRRRRRVLPSLCLCGALAIFVSGCGSGYRAGVTSATLTGATTLTTITTITATTTGVLGASLSHSSSLTLVVSK